MRTWIVCAFLLLVLASAATSDESVVLGGVELGRAVEQPVPPGEKKEEKKGTPSPNKKDAREEAMRLREEAKKRAQDRGKQSGKGGEPSKPAKKKSKHIEEEEQNKPQGMSREEARRLEKERKHKKRLLNLKIAREAAERKEAEKRGGANSRRMLAEQARPTCDDRTKNGLETDVDCGGEVCRKEFKRVLGKSIPKLCQYAQKCAVNKDCVSNKCHQGTCAAREAFKDQTSEELEVNILLAFLQLAEKGSTPEDLRLPNSNFVKFFQFVVNPDAQELSKSQQTFFDDRLQAFFKQQGLGPSGPSHLLFGFLSRGQPLQFIQTLLLDAKTPSIRQEL